VEPDLALPRSANWRSPAASEAPSKVPVAVASRDVPEKWLFAVTSVEWKCSFCSLLEMEPCPLQLDARLALGASRELVGELEELVALFPLRERLRGQLMLVLYRSGRQADALTAFQDARHTLVDELGIDPPGWSNSTAGSCSKTRHWEQSPLRSCIRPLAAHRPRQTRPAWSRGPRSSGLPSNPGGSSQGATVRALRAARRGWGGRAPEV
jgi:Bacterial transcriptional activator domain